MKSDRLLRHLRGAVSRLTDWLAHAAASLVRLPKGDEASRLVPVRIHSGIPHVRDFRRRGIDRSRIG